MLGKFIKFIGCVIVIGVFAFTIMFEAMPDLNNLGKAKAADQSAEVVVPTKNQKYIVRCEKVLDLLTQFGWNSVTEEKLTEFFDKSEDADLVLCSDGLGSDKNDYDGCYDVVESHTGSTEDFEDYADLFTYQINGDYIEWYCKEHNSLANRTPYLLSENSKIKELDQQLPGLCKWLKQVEDNAPVVETVDGEKVALEGVTEESTMIKDILVDLSSYGLTIQIYGANGYSYEELSDLYEPMEKAGWNLKEYYVDGVEKGFYITQESGSPSIIVKTDGKKITEIQITATDFEKENQPVDSSYVQDVNNVLDVAGIEDSIDEIYQMKNDGKGDNYKVYVSKCGTASNDGGEFSPYLGDDENFQTYLIDIYDIQ